MGYYAEELRIASTPFKLLKYKTHLFNGATLLFALIPPNSFRGGRYVVAKTDCGTC